MKSPAQGRSISHPRRSSGTRAKGRRRAGNARSPRGRDENAQLLALLPQVRFIARRIHRHLPSHVPVEDLYQAGVLGLLDALRKFDPCRKVRFESYMKFRIRGAILDELRSLDWSPRELRRRARQLEEAQHALRARLGREPAHEEVAAALRLSLRQLEHLRTELRGLELGSLQEIALISDQGVAKDRASLVPCPDSLGPQAMYAGQESHERLAEAIRLLPESERRVLTLYYYEELTMKEVGEVLAVGESRVSQIHSSALQHVRGWMSHLAAEEARVGSAASLRAPGVSRLLPRGAA